MVNQMAMWKYEEYAIYELFRVGVRRVLVYGNLEGWRWRLWLLILIPRVGRSTGSF
jgi:hypothetical protein